MTVVIVALVVVNLQNVKNHGEFGVLVCALIKAIAIVVFFVIGKAIMHLWPGAIRLHLV